MIVPRSGAGQQGSSALFTHPLHTVPENQLAGRSTKCGLRVLSWGPDSTAARSHSTELVLPQRHSHVARTGGDQSPIPRAPHLRRQASHRRAFELLGAAVPRTLL